MGFFLIEPEVAGHIGEDTVMDHGTHPPRVIHLHYTFDGWLGDALLESFPVFLITEEAKAALLRIDATGADFDSVKVTLSEQFEELYPGRMLPGFVWLRVGGTAGLDDAAIAPDGRLVVSARVLEALQSLGISHAEVSAYQTDADAV